MTPRRLGIWLVFALSLVAVPRDTSAQTAPTTNPWGIVDDYGTPQTQAAYTKAREAGLGFARYDLYWNFAEPQQGVFDWSRPDTAIARLQNAGFNILVRIVWPPAWATGVSYPNGDVPLYCLVNETAPDCSDPSKRPSTAAFTAFVRAAINRYKDRVRYWDFGTEVHNSVFYTGGADTFVREILVPGYQTAKSIDAGLTIVGPDEDIASWLEYLLQVEAVYGRWCDVISFHILRHSGGGLARLDNELKPVIDKYGAGRPVWLTEVGMMVLLGSPYDEIQAFWLVDQLTGIRLRPWIQKSFIYRLKYVDSGVDFGILYANDQPKAAWYAIRDFTGGASAPTPSPTPTPEPTPPPPPPAPAPAPTPTPAPPSTFELTVATSGSGVVTSSPAGISCGADCTEAYLQDTVVTLTPAAATGWMFAGWTGDADCADNAVAMTAARSCTAQFTPVGTPALNFNTDARADVFLYNPGTGAWSVELGTAANSFARAPSTRSTGSWSPGWTIKAAEFNGDAKTDLLLYNEASGVWFKAFSDGNGGFTYFSSSWSPGWTTLVLDLNGDGVSDVFLHNPANGAWFKCISNGTGDFVYYPGSWSPGWALYPADWNGDGKADLFLVSATDGQWFRATNDGGAGFTYYTESWSPGWSIYPGDFSGDGKTDIFLYSASTGQWFVCTNTGTSFSYATGTWGPDWSIDVGDLNADGRADIFLYSTTSGQWFEAVYNGVNEFLYYTSSWSAGWSVELMDFNFDGRSDVLLYNPSNGQWFQCVNLALAGFAYTSGAWSPGVTVVANRVTTP